MYGQPAPGGLIEAECIEGTALDDEDDDLHNHGFLQVWRLAVDDEGGMGKDEGDHGDAEVASVVEHEGVAARFNHAGIVMAPGTDGVGDDIAKNHEYSQKP